MHRPALPGSVELNWCRRFLLTRMNGESASYVFGAASVNPQSAKSRRPVR
jgi:hypothetical protein